MMVTQSLVVLASVGIVVVGACEAFIEQAPPSHKSPAVPLVPDRSLGQDRTTDCAAAGSDAELWRQIPGANR